MLKKTADLVTGGTPYQEDLAQEKLAILVEVQDSSLVKYQQRLFSPSPEVWRAGQCRRPRCRRRSWPARS